MDCKSILVASRSCFRSLDDVTEKDLREMPMPAPLTMADGAPAPVTIATDTRIDFSESCLFAFYRGKFDTLRYAVGLPVEEGSGKSHQLWQHSDVFELFVGPKARTSGAYKEFQVSPDNRFIDIDVNWALGAADIHWRSGMRCRSFIDHEKKLWTAVIAVPWNCFDADYRSDCEWNINLYRATGSYHGDELLAWSPTGYGERAFHRYANFGRIVFEK